MHIVRDQPSRCPAAAGADLDEMGAARRWLTAGVAALMITGSDGNVWAPSPPAGRRPPLTKWNWMISPGTHPRSAPEAVTCHGAGQYELRHTPSSARHPFILTSASVD